METNEYGQSIGCGVGAWTPRPMPDRVSLMGKHVTAEPIGPEHANDLFAALCGPDDGPLWTYRPAPRPQTRVEFEDSVVRLLAEHPDSASFAFIPANGSAAGIATFFPCVPASGVIEISGVLWSRSMQRTAAATEAIHLMLGYAFDDLGYRRVEWKCDSLNEPSRRAAARLGFTYEGRFRQHMVTKNRNRDTDWFSMLDSEWPSIRERHQRWLDPSNFDQHGEQRQRIAEV